MLLTVAPSLKSVKNDSPRDQSCAAMIARSPSSRQCPTKVKLVADPPLSPYLTDLLFFFSALLFSLSPRGVKWPRLVKKGLIAAVH